MEDRERGRFYVTTPIYYVNDVPHLGTAYTTVAADVLARYQRLRGRDTWFLTGTDEHGLKIERAAAEAGMKSSEFVDQAAVAFREAWQALGCEADDFIRTTEPRHKQAVSEIWRRVEASGDLYLAEYEGWYCVRCEAYYTEKELLPGNQCAIHGVSVERLREPSFFFSLSKYQDRLLDLYSKRPDFVLPDVRMNEVVSFVRGGLRDISVSRTSFDWGIRVPGQDRHVIYVWFDALTNYWSALRSIPEREKFWPPDVHLVGKDILRFHATYWPAFLMSAGFSDDELPRHVFAHGWLTIGGQKMSKTLRNAVTPTAVMRSLALVLGGVSSTDPALPADALRYYLMRAVAFGQDGDFSVEALLRRYNSELADGLGNLANRTLRLCELHCPGRVASTAQHALVPEFLKAARATAVAAAAELDSFRPHRALEEIWALVHRANEFIDQTAPWSVAKRGEVEECRALLLALVSALELLSVLVWPFMPGASRALRAQLGLPALTATSQDQWLECSFRDQAKLGGRSVLFPRIDPAGQATVATLLGSAGASAQ